MGISFILSIPEVTWWCSSLLPLLFITLFLTLSTTGLFLLVSPLLRWFAVRVLTLHLPLSSSPAVSLAIARSRAAWTGPRWWGEVWGRAERRGKGVRAPEALAGLLGGCWGACQVTPWLGAPTPPTHLLSFCPWAARTPPACARRTRHTTRWPRSNQKAPQTPAIKAWPIKRLGMAACPTTAYWRHPKAQSSSRLPTSCRRTSLMLHFPLWIEQASLRWCHPVARCRATCRPSSQLRLLSRGRGSCSRALPLSPPLTGPTCVPSALPLPPPGFLRPSTCSSITRTLLHEAHVTLPPHPLGLAHSSRLSPPHLAASPLASPRLTPGRQGLSTSLDLQEEALCWEGQEPEEGNRLHSE